jgi:hypothetical protein
MGGDYRGAGMHVIAVPHIGGRGMGSLLRLLLRLAVWHALFHGMRVFLIQYTHLPWVGALIVMIVVVALIRFAMYRRRRR